MMEKTYTVAKMKCEGCASNIRKALSEVAGVNELVIDVATKTVKVQFDEATVNEQTLQSAFTTAGYPAV